ncbi:unnamed protein product [Camellia sinensis]
MQAIHLGGEIFGIISRKKFVYNSINTARDMTNILIDGAWKRSLGGKAAAACIAFLDEELQIIICHARQLYLPSPLAAETKACVEAIKWAKAAKLKRITIQTDCQVLIRV